MTTYDQEEALAKKAEERREKATREGHAYNHAVRARAHLRLDAWLNRLAGVRTEDGLDVAGKLAFVAFLTDDEGDVQLLSLSVTEELAMEGV